MILGNFFYRGVDFRFPKRLRVSAADMENTMLRRFEGRSPQELKKWCAYALVLLAPGSFVILPVFWLVRFLGARAARQADPADRLRGWIFPASSRISG